MFFLRNGKHNKYFQNAFNKYGENNFLFVILEECDKQDLLIREQFWIDNCLPEYNMNKIAGSGLGLIFSKETRKKMSESAIKIASDPEERKLRSERLKKQWASGIMDHVTEKARIGFDKAREARMTAGLSGDFLTPEQHIAIGNKNRGRKNTLDSRKQMSESHKGLPWSDKQRESQAKTWTPERKKKHSEILKAYYDSLTKEEKTKRSRNQLAVKYNNPDLLLI